VSPSALTQDQIRIFQDRYATRDSAGELTEKWPEESWKRVALGVAEAERYYAARKIGVDIDGAVSENAERFYELMRDFRYVPGGRIIAAMGTDVQVTAQNCYVIPSPEDSRGGILHSLYEWVEIQSRGGGVGVNLSSLRPSGAPVRGVNGTSSGPVSWARLFADASQVIIQGGSRRGAAMIMMNDDHPDVKEFIHAKETPGVLEGCNMSVCISDAFMRAVTDDGPWELKWGGKVYETLRARDMWQDIVTAAWRSAEPGIYFMERANQEANSGYFETLISTNPCFTGDTLIAVADGRDAVSIKQLAEEGADVPVYCCDADGVVQIRTGRHPRVTRERAEVWRLTLDDGSAIRTTPDHKYLLRDGTKVPMRDLRPGDRLMPFSKAVLKRRTNSYMTVNRNDGRAPVMEHRMVVESNLGRPLRGHPEEIIHHADFNGLNNVLSNLLVMSDREHKALHYQTAIGLQAWWAEQDSEAKTRLNGMSGKRHRPESLAKIGAKTRAYMADPEVKERQRAGVREWYENHGTDFLKGERIEREKRVCANGHCSVRFEALPKSTRRHCSTYCSLVVLNEAQRGVPLTPEHRAKVGVSSKVWAETPEGRASKAKAGRETFRKYALMNGKIAFEQTGAIDMNRWDDYRELAKGNGCTKFVSRATIDRLFSTREQFVELAEAWNHRVVSIEPDGFQDVYNLTVDEFHTVAVITVPDGVSKRSGARVKTGIVTAQCGEQPLGPYGACLLGAFNLVAFVKQSDHGGRGEAGDAAANASNAKYFDLAEFKRLVAVAVRFNDNIVDISSYPLPECRDSQQRIRRMGIGVMGLADALIELGMRYGSGEAIEFTGNVFREMRDAAYMASARLAEERGPFPLFDSEKFLDRPFARRLPEDVRQEIARYGVRNCYLLTQAPTGTTAMVANVNSGIEPFFDFRYRRVDRTGSSWMLSPYAHRVYGDDGQGERLKSVDPVYVTANEVTPAEHVLMQAAAQKFVDASISKTANMPESATVGDVGEIYAMAWDVGLKSLSVYRDNSRSEQVLYHDKEDEAAAQAPPPIAARHKLPNDRAALTHKFEIGDYEGYITVGMYEDGTPGEVFVNVSKQGSTVNGLVDVIAMLMSFCMQYGVPYETLRDKLSGSLFEPAGRTSNKDVPFATSLPDYVVRFLDRKFWSREAAEPAFVERAIAGSPTGEACPKCGGTLWKAEGCASCRNCTYERCS